MEKRFFSMVLMGYFVGLIGSVGIVECVVLLCYVLLLGVWNYYGCKNCFL